MHPLIERREERRVVGLRIDPPADPLAEIRRRLRAVTSSMRPAAGFPVLGLAARRAASPVLSGTLVSAASVDGVWADVELAYGDPFSLAGPWIVVRSSRAPDRRRPVEAAATLAADERARAVDHTGSGYPTAEVGTGRRATVQVGASAVPCSRFDSGSLSVALLDPVVDTAGSPTSVSVLWRNAELAPLELAAVEDLGPYLDARERFFDEFVQRRLVEDLSSGRAG